MGEKIEKTLYHLSILPKLSEMQQQTDTALLPVPPSTPIDVWHQRLAHVSYKTILKMSSKQLVNGLQLPTNPLTPYEKWYGKKPDISHLPIFGLTAFIHVPKIERRKLESKSFKCYFVGYSLTQKAYRFWDPIDDLSELYPKPTNPATTPQQQTTNIVDVMPLVAGEMDIQPESPPDCSEQPDTTSLHPEDDPAPTEDILPDNGHSTEHGHDPLPSSTPPIRHYLVFY